MRFVLFAWGQVHGGPAKCVWLHGDEDLVDAGATTPPSITLFHNYHSLSASFATIYLAKFHRLDDFQVVTVVLAW